MRGLLTPQEWSLLAIILCGLLLLLIWRPPG